MTQKIPLRSPFAGIDFNSNTNSSNQKPGQIIEFSNDAPSFPVELPKVNTNINVSESQPLINNQFPNISKPQELSGNISLVGGYSIFNPKNNTVNDTVFEEPPLLEGNFYLK